MAWLHKLTDENINSLYYGEDYEEPFTGYYQSENAVLYNKRIVITWGTSEDPFLVKRPNGLDFPDDVCLDPNGGYTTIDKSIIKSICDRTEFENDKFYAFGIFGNTYKEITVNKYDIYEESSTTRELSTRELSTSLVCEIKTRNNELESGWEYYGFTIRGRLVNFQNENMTAILLVYVTPEGKAFIWSSLGKDSNALKYMNNLIPEITT